MSSEWVLIKGRGGCRAGSIVRRATWIAGLAAGKEGDRQLYEVCLETFGIPVSGQPVFATPTHALHHHLGAPPTYAPETKAEGVSVSSSKWRTAECCLPTRERMVAT